MVDTVKLRSLIRGKYNSNKEFAKEIGISESGLCLILAGKKKMSFSTCEAMIEKLEIPEYQIKRIFFTNEVVKNNN